MLISSSLELGSTVSINKSTPVSCVGKPFETEDEYSARFGTATELGSTTKDGTSTAVNLFTKVLFNGEASERSRSRLEASSASIVA
jgi:hypothetical protein